MTRESVSQEIKQARVEGMENKAGSVPRLVSILSGLVMILIAWLFFSGELYRFYASMLFFYYSLLGEMWWSVIGLGITQTLILIPLRIIRVAQQANIGEFKKKTMEMKGEHEQTFYIKKRVESGDRVILFYTIDFFIQLASYLTIGRLFLTDFYNKALDANLLYNFVKYPTYPIEGIVFKIPYPWFSKTIDFGWENLLWVWGVLILVQVAIFALRYFLKVIVMQGRDVEILPKKLAKYTSGYVVILMLIAWVLVRNFPSGWSIRWFTGLITIPNRRFNTVTALVTFGTLMWFGVNRIKRKTDLAINLKVKTEVIEGTQKEMFTDTLRTAVLVGLGAYFITNQIPSAFELSIFTLELISLASPLTLDRIITKAVKASRKIDNVD